MNLKNGIIKKFIKSIQPVAGVADFLLAPFTLLSIVWFRIIRYWGVKNLKIAQFFFLRLGMIPIVDHYYEPLIDYRKLPTSLPKTRLDLDAAKQIEFIKDFNFRDELMSIPMDSMGTNKYYYHNSSFCSGDAELYYSIIRHYKPGKILEVGSGFSTLLALEAIGRNKEHDSHYVCEVTCIEPFEMPFLESLNIHLIRQPVEQVDKKVFAALQRGDILFIDSSHIIRPGGDVTFLILEVLSEINSGVLVHFHDIFIPHHYPKEWLKDEFRLWNEQYLLEAFLLHNKLFEIVFSIYYMNLNYKSELNKKFPVFEMEPHRKPGSFWIQKTN